MTADVVTGDSRVVIRRMFDDDSDYSIVAAWQNEPHVRHFWDPDLPPPTTASVRSQLQSDAAGASPTTVCIIEFDGRPVGFMQFYPWSAYPEELQQMDLELNDGDWGLDILIGDPDLVGAGIGSRAVELLSDHLMHDRGVSSVVLLTDVENLRAQRAYEKAGFVREKEVLDLDTRDGDRIHSFLMRRARGLGHAAGR